MRDKKSAMTFASEGIHTNERETSRERESWTMSRKVAEILVEEEERLL
jgi:hypothetical protein